MNYSKLSDENILDSFNSDIANSAFNIPNYYYHRLKQLNVLDDFDPEDIRASALAIILEYSQKKVLFNQHAIKPYVSKDTLTIEQNKRYAKLAKDIENWLNIRNSFAAYKIKGRLPREFAPFFLDIRQRLIVYLSKPLATTLALD
jgi:hypothetical protein